MSQLELTTSESRHLFKHLHDAIKEIYKSNSTSLNSTEEDIENDPLWKAVDEEFRKAYEMSRYALQITDLPNYLNIDVFAGNCEDTDGMEPLNESLLKEITECAFSIMDIEERNNTYRITIPQQVESQIQTHTAKMKQIFDQLLNERREVVPSINEMHTPKLSPQQINDNVDQILAEIEEIKTKANLFL